MNKLLKLLAFIMALVIAVSCFASCGETTTDEDGTSDSTATDSTDDTETEEEDSETETETLSAGLYIDGEAIDTDNLVMLTITGDELDESIEVMFDEYRYMYMYLLSYYGLTDDSYWEDNDELFDTFISIVDYYVEDNQWGAVLADMYDIELTDEDYDTIAEVMQEEIDSFDSEDEFYEALEASGITYDLLERVVTQSVLCERVYQVLYGDDGAILLESDDEIKENLQNDYVRVYHVLITFDHFADDDEYADATDDELEAAALAYAEEILAEIQASDDIEAAVYEYAQDADDSGMVDNEVGYMFTTGQMVEDFENAAFALEVGELSGIVESVYGYHIIYRLEQDEYIEENWDELKEDYISIVFNSYVDDALANCTMTYSDYHDMLSYGCIQ
ncbi:MAG: peptidyl-prolyl cis-trans isomerase [Oscillospiraceae bacterium]|nr:peptidyl-prolyl cis-trans isomerase [Oscillospiraceae bacterium]